MKTRDFLNALNAYGDHALIFYRGGERIRPGYHVTEIKAVSVRGMDCGGQGDAWGETVIQLWTPEVTDDPMSVGKFLGIYHRVASQIPVEEGAEVRLEYGEQGAPAVSYFVGEVQPEGEEVVVRLEPPFVTCKANERLEPGASAKSESKTFPSSARRPTAAPPRQRRSQQNRSQQNRPRAVIDSNSDPCASRFSCSPFITLARTRPWRWSAICSFSST